MAHSRFTDEQWDQVQKLMKECSLKALEKDRPHKIWCTEHDDCVEWVGDVAFSYEALSTCPEFALSGGHLKSLFAEGQKYAYDAAFLPGANESQHSQLQAFRGEFDAIIKSGRVVLDTVTVKDSELLLRHQDVDAPLRALIYFEILVRTITAVVDAATALGAAAGLAVQVAPQMGSAYEHIRQACMAESCARSPGMSNLIRQRMPHLPVYVATHSVRNAFEQARQQVAAGGAQQQQQQQQEPLCSNIFETMGRAVGRPQQPCDAGAVLLWINWSSTSLVSTFWNDMPTQLQTRLGLQGLPAYMRPSHSPLIVQALELLGQNLTQALCLATLQLPSLQPSVDAISHSFMGVSSGMPAKLQSLRSWHAQLQQQWAARQQARQAASAAQAATISAASSSAAARQPTAKPLTRYLLHGPQQAKEQLLDFLKSGTGMVGLLHEQGHVPETLQHFKAFMADFHARYPELAAEMQLDPAGARGLSAGALEEFGYLLNEGATEYNKQLDTIFLTQVQQVLQLARQMLGLHGGVTGAAGATGATGAAGAAGAAGAGPQQRQHPVQHLQAQRSAAPGAPPSLPSYGHPQPAAAMGAIFGGSHQAQLQPQPLGLALQQQQQHLAQAAVGSYGTSRSGTHSDAQQVLDGICVGCIPEAVCS